MIRIHDDDLHILFYISNFNFFGANRVVRNTKVLRILDISENVQTLDHLSHAKRKLSMPAEFGGRNVPSLELDFEHAHYASFTATLANMITDYESESIDPMYGLVLHELLHVATSTLPWAVQVRSSYDMISNMGEYSESDLVVLIMLGPISSCWYLRLTMRWRLLPN
jgi:hypothetical protein